MAFACSVNIICPCGGDMTKPIGRTALQVALDMVIKDYENSIKPKCPICGGQGSYYMEGDLHKSGGNIPCRYTNPRKKEYCVKGELKSYE